MRATALILAALAIGTSPGSGVENPWAEPTREILLSSPCAKCHDGDRSTAQEDALVVYDLTDGSSWYDRMSDAQLRGFLGRLGPFTDGERESIRHFVDCAVNGECEAAED